MVGDSWDQDIEPAASLGLFTFWIQPSAKNHPDLPFPTASGSLAGLYELIEAGWLEDLSTPAG